MSYKPKSFDGLFYVLLRRLGNKTDCLKKAIEISSIIKYRAIREKSF